MELCNRTSSSMNLEKEGRFRKKKIVSFFSSFCMTKRKIFCPFCFYKMGRWRLRKANRHNPKGIKGESETSPFSSNIVIQERSDLYYNVIACSICGFIFSILLWGLQPHRAQSLLQNQWQRAIEEWALRHFIFEEVLDGSEKCITNLNGSVAKFFNFLYLL